MFKHVIIFLSVFLLIFLTAGETLAWGPGVHMAAGNFILTNCHLIPPAIAALIMEFPNQFLYGCLSADIFIGKGSKHKPRHSHNWSTGIKLLKASDDDQTKAYSYGYLTHLAADTIAHNFYVPNLLGLSPWSGTFGHIYIEALADQKVDWSRKQAIALFKELYITEDNSLRNATQNRKISFLMRKQLFKSSLSLYKKKSWNSSLGLMDRAISLEKDDVYLNNMLNLSITLSLSCLKDGPDSPALSLDPIGSKNLARIKRLRYRKKVLRKNGSKRHLIALHPELEQMDLN